MMNSSMLKKEIMEMRQQMMKVKDSLKWMEERSAMLQEHWEGEAGTTWVNTFMEWLRMDTEHVTAMQEILDRAEQMGILLAAVEQNSSTNIGTVNLKLVLVTGRQQIVK